MKQTKKFLRVLRIAAGVAVFLLIALYALVIGFDLIGIYKAMVAAWPVAVVAFVCYAVFSLGEDFVNNRILRPHL